LRCNHFDDIIAITFIREAFVASLTIRKLDDAIKAYLRLRSATNGRSVEEEVRVILREYLEGSPVPDAALLLPAAVAQAPRRDTSRAKPVSP